MTKLASGVEFTLYDCKLTKESGKSLSQGEGTNIELISRYDFANSPCDMREDTRYDTTTKTDFFYVCNFPFLTFLKKTSRKILFLIKNVKKFSETSFLTFIKRQVK